MIKKINLPPATKNEVKKPTLPFNGNIVTQEHLSFSFACFDRSHKLFNLGANTDDGAVEGQWFIDLMDCFKSVSNQKIANLKQSLHDLHPID